MENSPWKKQRQKLENNSHSHKNFKSRSGMVEFFFFFRKPKKNVTKIFTYSSKERILRSTNKNTRRARDRSQ